MLRKYVSRLVFPRYIHYFESLVLNYVVTYKQVLNFDILSFLVILRIVGKVDGTLIIVVEYRDERIIVVIVSLP